jgi:hypothetical protein
MTPDDTKTGFDSLFDILIIWVRRVMYEDIHLKKLPENPRIYNLQIKILWSTHYARYIIKNSMIAMVILHERLRFSLYSSQIIGALQRAEFETKCNEIWNESFF